MADWQFSPFWQITRWGFLSDFYGRSCDEWHNPSRYLIIPLVGMIVRFDVQYPRSGPEHLYAHGPTGWEGADVLGCSICEEIKAEIVDGSSD